MLVGLLEPAGGTAGREGQKHHYLRNAAHHGAMDYLTEVPQDISRSIPDSLDSYTERADQVTRLLDNILHQQAPPPHLCPENGSRGAQGGSKQEPKYEAHRAIWLGDALCSESSALPEQLEATGRTTGGRLAV